MSVLGLRNYIEHDRNENFKSTLKITNIIDLLKHELQCWLQIDIEHIKWLF